ncbi:hypothetical protein HMPREF0185_02322 [Brevundimonas diminuta 470-4]|nr:hypothetical protein HMPREF0185_02322 [Brevundimonas diminuta 470-4]
MSLRHVLLAGVVVAGLAISGAGVASVLMDLPQDATPAPADPIGDMLRDTSRTPLQNPQGPATQPQGQSNSPTIIMPTAPAAAPATPVVAAQGEEVAIQEELPDEIPAEEVAPAPKEPASPPGVRQRRRIAVIQAVDKTTAETMRFEVEVGGRPVRFGRTLLFKARACEVSASDEMTEDAIAYMEVGVQPRGLAAPTEARQVFKGWMFASSPSVSGLQHPVYDAWVVGCKA